MAVLFGAIENGGKRNPWANAIEAILNDTSMSSPQYVSVAAMAKEMHPVGALSVVKAARVL